MMPALRQEKVIFLFFFYPGGSSYHTGTVNPNLEKTNQYFPKDTFLTFDNANPAQILGKLKFLQSNLAVPYVNRNQMCSCLSLQTVWT